VGGGRTGEETAVTGSFFDVPQAEAESPWQGHRPDWTSPPEDVLPAVIAVDRVLARSDRAVVALSAVRAFPTGVAFGLAVWVRGYDDDDWAGMPRGVFPGRRVTEYTFRFGVELADGRRASNLVRPHCDDAQDPDGPVLIFSGGASGGPEGQVQFDLWLWPLPPPGRLRVVCEWPAYDIAETSVELDATELVDAAARARPVWDQ